MKLSARAVHARMREPFVTAGGSVQTRELALVTLTGSDGAVGYGEAAPLAPVRIDECLAAIEECRGPLQELGEAPREQLLEACAQVALLAPALAAIDVALWDIEARRRRVPVWRLLGVTARPDPVEVNATIAAADRAAAAAAAGEALKAGFRCVKVKVGLGDDAGRLAAVRAASGASMAIRIDANGAWSVDEAIASLRALEPIGLELCEEPVHGVDELASVHERTPVKLALDESAVLPGALERRAADAACLKIAAGGGLTGVLAAARRARASGYELYLASTLDGPLGIAAALHACAALGPDRPCGLATLALFADRTDPLPARDGKIELPSGPGLGDGLTGWYD
ncbi:MAG TPA: mandelate racemase/muconate lactonizing enzyme family protein [Solirubrobacteraceae bacterium]|nr:mandelate racemase/muconate lactonizing enzyme family protein [Solirubrobacteraceae bacterium]